MNKHETLRVFLVSSIGIRTQKDHPGNYIADKISQCGRQYESDCNRNVIERFWFGQFDSENLADFIDHIVVSGLMSEAQVNEIYMECSRKGFYSFK